MPSHVITLANGITMPTLGQGTWFMGESSSSRKDEIAALQKGIDLGMTLIDTAEMYASGGAEKVAGEAIAGRRDKVFLVSKVLPGNASRKGTIAAFERSLKRLGTDYIDLYLLHWRGGYPLDETFDAMERLLDAGKIRAYGVSNFDLDDMQEASQYDRGHICVNQVLYNLASRGIEWGSAWLAEKTQCRRDGLFSAVSDTSFEESRTQKDGGGTIHYTGAAGAGMASSSGNDTDSEIIQCQAG